MKLLITTTTTRSLTCLKYHPCTYSAGIHVMFLSYTNSNNVTIYRHTIKTKQTTESLLRRQKDNKPSSFCCVNAKLSVYVGFFMWVTILACQRDNIQNFLSNLLILLVFIIAIFPNNICGKTTTCLFYITTGSDDRGQQQAQVLASQLETLFCFF